MRSISQAESQAAAARARVAAGRVHMSLGTESRRENPAGTVREVRSRVTSRGRSRQPAERPAPTPPKPLRMGRSPTIMLGSSPTPPGRWRSTRPSWLIKPRSSRWTCSLRLLESMKLQQRSQDDGMSRLERQKRNRKSWIKTDSDDGMTVLYGRFDPITGARIKNVLSAKTNQLWRAENPKQRPTTAQRMADALAELLCEPGQGKGKSRRGQRCSWSPTMTSGHNRSGTPPWRMEPPSRWQCSKIWHVKARSFPPSSTPATSRCGLEWANGPPLRLSAWR